MTDLRDPVDDLIRDAVHELVGAAPDPKPVPELSPATSSGSRRVLAVAASVTAVLAVVGAVVWSAQQHDDPGTVASPAPATGDEPGDDEPAIAEDDSVRAPVEWAPAWWPDGHASVDATLIGRAPDGVLVEIDTGSADGVDVGMPVVDDRGLIGTIVTIFPRTAIVELAVAPDARTGIGVFRGDPSGDAHGIAEATLLGGDPPSLIALSLTDDADPPRIGDRLLTSTSGEFGGRVFGIPVGTIVGDGSDVELVTSLDDGATSLRVIVESMSVPEPMLEESFEGPTPAALTREPVAAEDGSPWLSTGVIEHLVELGGRRLAWALEPSGAAWSYLAAWIDDGDGWEYVDLTAQFGVVADGEQPVVGDWPAAIATDGSLAVAVGADAMIDELQVSSSPRVWISSDLRVWESVEIEGRGRLDDVVRADDGWIAVGEIDGQQTILQSDDARSWEQVLGAGAPGGFERRPTVAAVAGRTIVTFGHGMIVHSDDGGRGWSDVPLGANPLIYSAGGDHLVRYEPLQLRFSWSTDGENWIVIDDTPDAWLDPNVDPRRLRFASLAVEQSLLLTDGSGLWKLRDGEPVQEYDLTQHLPDTQWGPSYITGLEVLRDGTIVVLGAIPHEPGTKPVNELVVLTSDGDPAARARDAAVHALVEAGFTDIGSDHDIPGSATFGVEALDGSVVTGSLIAGLTEPLADLADNEIFIACDDLGITVRADTAADATAAVLALGDLRC